MDVSGGTPADLLECITEALVICSNEGPIHSDKVPRRTGSPYPAGSLRGIGARVKTRDPADDKDHQSQGTIMPS